MPSANKLRLLGQRARRSTHFKDTEGLGIVEKSPRLKRSTILFIVGIVIVLGGLVVAGSRGGSQDCQSCHPQGPPPIPVGRAPKLPPMHPALPGMNSGGAAADSEGKGQASTR